MKKKFIAGVVIFIIVVCLGLLFSSYSKDTNTTFYGATSRPVEKPKIISGEQINFFSGAFRNITIDISIPETLNNMRIYKGSFRQGDLVENISGSTKAINNPIPEDQAPDIARKILEEQYGGLPPDAQLQYSSIMSLEKRNLSTGALVKEIPYETFVSWTRLIDGMRIEGGSDGIQVELGENGDVIRVYKRWRTYEPLENVSIISASKAIDKLEAGEVLNPSSGYDEDVSIYNMHLSYYVDGIDKPEVTLEPIWVFYGNTTMGHLVPFFVYARQFANFTATPTGGNLPLTVMFNDTSDASPTRWLWDFGDGTNATVQHPAHTYYSSGSYNVTLKAWNDLGSDTIERARYVTVRNPEPPVANFTAEPRSGFKPLMVTFNDTSTNTPTSWLWTFGDGTNATVQNPEHKYLASGNYTVSLNVTNDDGTNSVTKPDYIGVSDLPQTTLTTSPTTTSTTLITTTTVTTTVTTTTKSTPTMTYAPLLPTIAMAGVAIAGLLFVIRNKSDE